MVLLKVVVLIALIKLLLALGKPIVCAGIYAGIRFVFMLLLGAPLLAALIGTAIVFGLALLYFWLLNRFRDGGLFWLVLFVGLVIVLL